MSAKTELHAPDDFHVLTLGHSTRPLAEFAALLQGHHVARLIDIRTVPGMRHDTVRDQIGYEEVFTDTAIVKVSVVGVGMRSNAGIAAQMFQALAGRGINVLAITTSEIKVSVLIAEEYTELAVRVLHTSYGLDSDEPVPSEEEEA